LLLRNDGRFASFRGALSFLNNVEDKSIVTLGVVYRHRMRRFELNARRIANLGIPQGRSQERAFSSYSGPDTQLFLHQLRTARPEGQHNWGLIIALCSAYLVLVGPVNILIAKKVRDHKWAMGFFILLVIVFSYAFEEVGKDGYGQERYFHSIGSAKYLGDEAYDLTQWTHIFVDDGRRYELTHEGGPHLYSVLDDEGAVAGEARHDGQGRMSVEIPINSDLVLRHRGRVKGLPPIESVLEWPENPDAANPIRLKMGPGFPKTPVETTVHIGNRQFQPLVVGDELRIGVGFGGRNITRTLDIQPNWWEWTRRYTGYYESTGKDDQQIPTVRLFQFLSEPLRKHSLGAGLGYSPPSIDGLEILEVLITAEGPASWRLKGCPGKESSMIVYKQVVKKPAR
jgi:hypothetical protein